MKNAVFFQIEKKNIVCTGNHNKNVFASLLQFNQPNEQRLWYMHMKYMYIDDGDDDDDDVFLFGENKFLTYNPSIVW